MHGLAAMVKMGAIPIHVSRMWKAASESFLIFWWKSKRECKIYIVNVWFETHQDYLRDNYCPTLESTADQHFCEDSLSKYYIGMLVNLYIRILGDFGDQVCHSLTQFGVVEHYFVDGALHVCQTSGTCSAREWVDFQVIFLLLLGVSKVSF